MGSLTYYYRPQTKFGQGNIFAPVCHSVHRGEYQGRYPVGRYTPLQAGTPWVSTPPGRYTPLGWYTTWQVHRPGRYIPLAGTPAGRYTPFQQCMLGYGQQADSTHPTGMHSCLDYFFCQKLYENEKIGLRGGTIPRPPQIHHWTRGKCFWYLPLTNEVCDGYVFTSICHSVHGEGGVCIQEGMHPGGVCIQGGGLHPGDGQTPHWILRDMVNERVVRILLECILISPR